MASGVEERPIRPLTADEVMRMVELGILDEDENVELLRGVLRAMSAKTPAHETVKMRLVSWLMAGDAGRHHVRVESPFVVPDRTSLPEPDITVVEPGDYTRSHPSRALLVIEVAVSSLRTDARIKPPLYAAAGVPELWVVDVEGRCVRVFTDPRPDGYGTERAAGARDVLRPRAVEVAPLPVRDLLAGL